MKDNIKMKSKSGMSDITKQAITLNIQKANKNIYS